MNKQAEDTTEGFLNVAGDALTRPVFGTPDPKDTGVMAQLQHAANPLALLGMGAAGLGGGAWAGSRARRIERPGETPAERRRRILRDTVAGAALPAGAVGAGSLALTAGGAVRPERTWAEKNIRDKGRLYGLGAVAGGASQLARFHMPRFGGVRDKRIQEAAEALRTRVRPTLFTKLKDMEPNQLTAALRADHASVRADVMDHFQNQQKYRQPQAMRETDTLLRALQGQAHPQRGIRGLFTGPSKYIPTGYGTLTGPALAAGTAAVSPMVARWVGDAVGHLLK